MTPRPLIDPRASAAAALIQGDVQIGAGTCIPHGAKIVAQGAPVRIGTDCIVAKNAVVRGAGRHPGRIGDRVLTGPHARVSGAEVEAAVFIATGAVVLNGAKLDRGTVVRVHGAVHIGTRCPPGTVVPIGHVAYGDPARVPAPETAATTLGEPNFTAMVFGFDSAGCANAEATAELCARYGRTLYKSNHAP